MRRPGWTAAAPAIVILASLTATAIAAEKATPRGRQVFEAQKCNLCHAVSTAGIEAKTTSDKLKGPDLVDLGKSHEAEWIAKYVKKEADREGKSHRREFKGTDEELQVLVDWLLEQKAE